MLSAIFPIFNFIGIIILSSRQPQKRQSAVVFFVSACSS